ncbi:MAG TPA: tyrosine--tRNA ligase [Gemmatimonadales bacterium]|nr:tyrosine--tRNA ligase [Gemmatimonadales bacterium]
MPHLLETLAARDMVHDATPGLAERLATGPITAYIGFDPTADSLHVGNLVPVMALAWLQRLGGRPIALVGGGTGLVGDPSGKRSERPMLEPETVRRNADALRAQLSRFLDFGPGPTGAVMRDNAEWLAPLGLLEFLRDTGKHFTISYMLQKDTVRSRLDSGISFTEFSYMLVQAHDFAHLAAVEGCELQMGGSDQWGNITAGIELAGRRDGRKVHGLVLPLLTTAAGTKFGKSEAGNVWLDPARTSPYQFHQFWLRTDDADVERLLRFFTFLPVEDIAALMVEHARDPAARVAQRALADEVTTRVHGAGAVARATRAAAILFGAEELAQADAETREMVRREVPEAAVTEAELAAGIAAIELFVRAGLAESKKQARQFAGTGALRLGDRVVEVGDQVTAAEFGAHEVVFLRRGKRQWAALRRESPENRAAPLEDACP